MPTSKGYRRKTRSLMKGKHGVKQGLSAILRPYSVNDKVVIDINPTKVKGMPHRRFQGLVGVVEEVGRRSLSVCVPVGGKIKKVITRLEHVKPHKEAGTREGDKG